MPDGDSISKLVDRREQLLTRVEDGREELENLDRLIEIVSEQLAQDEFRLNEIDSVLGRRAQLQLEDADLRLRGRRLEEVAAKVLAEEQGVGVDIHYKQWFKLLRSRGYWVGGKEPVNTFLTQINRSEAVERVGRRTGIYRLKAA